MEHRIEVPQSLTMAGANTAGAGTVHAGADPGVTSSRGQTTTTPLDGTAIHLQQPSPRHEASLLPLPGTNGRRGSATVGTAVERRPCCFRFGRWFQSWPQSLRSIMYLLLGNALLCIPVILDLFLFVENRGQVGFFQYRSKAEISSVPMMYWFLYMMVLWTVLITTQYVVRVLPKLILWLVYVCLGRPSRERLRPRLEYVRQLYAYISFVVMNIVATVTWAIFFPYEAPSGNDVTAVGYPWQGVVYKVIQCSLVLSILLLLEKLLVQIVSVNFHRKAYSERIVEHKFASFVVERLYSAKKRILAARKKRLEQEQQRAAAARRQSYKLLTTAITPHTSPPDAGETSGSSKSLTSVLKKRRSMPIRGSEQNIADAPSSNAHGRLASSPDAPTLQPSPMTISPESVNPQSELPATTAAQSTTSPVNSHDEVYNDSDAASIASETTRRNKAGKRFGSFNFLAAVKDVTKIDTIMRQTRGVFGNMEGWCIELFEVDVIIRTITDMQSVDAAYKLAKSVFVALCSPERNMLQPHDFYPHFADREEAQRAFKLFDQNENGDVSMEEMTVTMKHIYEEKAAIERGLRDFGDTVGKLDNILLTFALIVTALICLSLFNINLQAYLVSAASIILATSFMIGNSAKNLFESIIYVFAMHPFDVGDKIELDQVTYTIKHMGLLLTVMTRTDGQEFYITNSILTQKSLYNIRRSGQQSEVITAYIALNTSRAQIDQLHAKLVAFVTKHSRDFQPKMMLFLDGLEVPIVQETQGKMRLKLIYFARSNFQDGQKRVERRTMFLLAMKEAMLELGVAASSTPPTSTSAPASAAVSG